MTAFWLPPQQASGRQLEWNRSTTEFSMIPSREISSVVRKVDWVPASRGASSHSSPSAMAAVPIAFLNCERCWLPAVCTHHFTFAKLQPAHSVTPSLSGYPSSSSKPCQAQVPGTSSSLIDQPSGPSLVQTCSPATPSSTLGPSSTPSKSSLQMVMPRLACTPTATSVLMISPPSLVILTRYLPASATPAWPSVYSALVAPSMATPSLNHW